MNDDDHTRWQQMAQAQMEGLRSDDPRRLGNTLDELAAMQPRTRASLVTVMADINREGGLPYEIVRVLYTKGIDDPDTQEQSRDVVAAFADLAFAEAVQEQMRPTRPDVRFMLEGVDEPDMTGSDGAEPPA